VLVLALSRADRVFPFFIGSWIVLGIVGLLLFVRPGDAERKKRLFGPFTVGVGVLFILFVMLMGVLAPALPLLVPAVALIMFLNVRNTRFCPDCGRLVPTRGFTRPRYCPSCGHALT
jgi:hypothetical protein